MPTLTLKTTVADDRHLAINLTLPPDFPTGIIEIAVRTENVPATDNALPHGSRWVPVAELLESWRRNPLPETEMQALSEFDTFRHEQHPARFRMMPATGWWIASSPTPNATCDPASWVDSVTGRFQQI